MVNIKINFNNLISSDFWNVFLNIQVVEHLYEIN